MFTEIFFIFNLIRDVFKMPGKVARTGGGSKTQPPKKTTSSSSKSSGSSKTSSSSNVKKATPPPAKPKNVDKVDFGKPKPTASAGVYKKPPVMKSAVTSKSAGTATVSQTTVRQSTHFGLHNEGAEPKINRVDLPMKPPEDLKPDGHHQMLEEHRKVRAEHEPPELAAKMSLLLEMPTVVAGANHAFRNLAVPCQNFVDACNAIDGFLATQSVQQVIKDTLHFQKYSDTITMFLSGSDVLEAAVAAGAETSAAVGAAGLAAAGEVAKAKVFALLDNLSNYFAEAETLKQNLQQAYNMLVRATDKFNLRNSEIFELCEGVGADTNGKTITYPADLDQIKKTFKLFR